MTKNNPPFILGRIFVCKKLILLTFISVLISGFPIELLHINFPFSSSNLNSPFIDTIKYCAFSFFEFVCFEENIGKRNMKIIMKYMLIFEGIAIIY